jgi:hypothetical protein
MIRRIIIAVVGGAALVAMVLGWFYLKRNIALDNDPFAAVAGDAVVIVRTGPARGFLSALSHRNLFWSDLNTVLNSSYLVSRAAYLDSLLDADPRAGRLAEDRSLYLSVHPSGKENYETVFYLGLSGASAIRAAGEVVSDMLKGVSTVTRRTFGRTTIWEAPLKTPDGNRVLSWTVSRGILIMSFSPILLENAVIQSGETQNITGDPVFQKVHSTSGMDVDANIYVNLELFPRYLASFSKSDPGGFLYGLSDLGSWAELDLHLRDDGLLLNGFSCPAPDGSSYLDIFSGQSPVQASIETVIPGHSSAFLALGLSDPELFQENYLKWLETSGRLPGYLDRHKQFLRLTGHEPAQTFFSIMDQEAALVFTGRDDQGGEGESFLVIRTLGRSLALESLLDMVSFHAAQNGDNDNNRLVYGPGGQEDPDIYSFPFPETGGLLFGTMFGRVNTSYFSFIGNYLVFGASPRALSEFIRANILGQTLDAGSRNRDFSDYLVSRNNFYFYLNVPRSAGLLTGLVREDLAENLVAGSGQFRRFRYVALQFSTSRDMLYNNLFLLHSPEILEEPRTEWQTRLDTLTGFKPLMIVNHNTGENEIFVQDISNNIYLISNTGRILWKKPLSGPITGNVYQIDYYKNNRLQMLFNTRDRIYLVDRNGNDVGRYPVRLPSPATNGISVFDYDNDGNYRIFIACEDRSVTVRSKEGNIISGWEFPGTDHNVYNEIRFFRTGGRDHIVFADRHRVYITDRRGNIRVRPDRAFPVSGNNSIGYEGKTPLSEPRMAVTDTTGRVWHIYFDGRTEVIETDKYSPGHFFEFYDINGDGFSEYVILDRDRLDVYSRNGSLLISREFSVPISCAPAFYYFSANDRRIGVVSREKGQIFLVDSDGEICEGFPLAGNSAFTIGFLQDDRQNFNLIVASGNNFLYNYTLN